MNFRIFLLAAAGITFFFPAFSQEDDNSLSGSVGVKWAPVSIYFGKISLSGEYSLNNKHSVTLGIGIPFNNTVTQEIDGEDESLSNKTFSIMGGYRMYLGKGAGKGLYFEPYLKYLKHEANGTIDRPIGGSLRTFEFTSDYSGIGLGAQLGVQFVIARSVLLDFYFLGPEGNISKHNTFSREIGNAPPWDDQDVEDAEQEIRDFFSDIPFLRDKIEVSINASDKTATTNFKGFLPGLRAGISIGIRF